MKTTALQYGKAIPGSVRCVALEWRAKPVEVDESGTIIAEDRLFKGLPAAGLYAYEGTQDAHVGRSILYIGQAGSKGQSLGTRAAQSFARIRDRTDGRLYSDCDQIVFRWAEFTDDDKSLLKHVEGLLIRAHCPAFNKQEVRSWFQGPRDLLIVNAGFKGRILPAVAAMYHSEEGWPKSTPETDDD